VELAEQVQDAPLESARPRWQPAPALVLVLRPAIWGLAQNLVGVTTNRLGSLQLRRSTWVESEDVELGCVLESRASGVEAFSRALEQ